MSVDAIDGISPLAAPASVSPVAAAVPAAPSTRARAQAFGQVLQSYLQEPRAGISAVRSEIAAIRTGAILREGPSFVEASGRDSGSAALSARGLTAVPGWLEAQLAAQATGDAADPYGWRTASREIAERVIGPGYGALFERQIDQESGFLPDVVYGRRVSSAGAEGIAQLMPQYYPNVARTDPVAGLTAGAESMRHYLGVWDGDVRKALASYNAGLGRVQSLVRAHGAGWEAGLPLETRHYLSAIVGDATPVFGGAGHVPVAVFGGRGPGGVLTSPLEGASARRSSTTGLDYFGGVGARVQSPAEGVVVQAQDGRIALDHGNGWRSFLEGVAPSVALGATVRRSDPLGALGAGGLLRLGVSVDGRAVDPAPYLLSSL